ncbi:YdeI family protein [Flavobacterium sp. M31R6]|uniref:YdeI/OmpD-associated family protein n=1 Tax=Flavobacterium sp. M31R6 TaxID=2739062 RepID=UPI00156A2282|nr:YdeI/OmpD-associated family protein [Flavobacterium sp. M31R6]QKJ63045.1 YdeI/OmpD-associated family protein [Flavobacterium sp. M31R6]
MTQNDQWESELELLKTIIAKTELVETNKWGGCVFVYNNKNVIGVGGFKKFFTLWFFNGVFLKDEKKHLINANEGVTKSLRQWRFTSKEEINEKEILAYIQEAIENEKQGKIIKPEKTKAEVIIPTLLQNELDCDSDLKEAFLKFSPSKQKEFIEYIETAKREETRLSRIEKIKPMILDNIGLNDKYR